MAEQLTLKQRKWISIYLECGNATEAAMQVYDCKDRDSANAIGSENLAKLSYADFMEEAGITDKLLQQKLMEGLDSQRVISAMKTGKQATGADSDFIEVPDMIVRHKYLETAFKLKKRLTDKEVTINVDKMLILDGHGTNLNAPTDESSTETTDGARHLITP